MIAASQYRHAADSTDQKGDCCLHDKLLFEMQGRTISWRGDCGATIFAEKRSGEVMVIRCHSLLDFDEESLPAYHHDLAQMTKRMAPFARPCRSLGLPAYLLSPTGHSSGMPKLRQRETAGLKFSGTKHYGGALGSGAPANFNAASVMKRSRIFAE
ncbi:MAG: hypothetical protein ONB48_19400 [candidate division KSB1 bacterium]|nr:hypothetical protein [candidate division KSB1 bacterium]MDZ7274143.1 hypothetical protein [candidate division KSB1 bacterium]MDZ7287812.1 hypothetical protein [candidate division KSB1 bacterium]MDZ7296742.1 hypothetical protein [candidate division KSB1 bacterium]MDZ7347608.1 hypothetical protein [candidate division KSB1 bacterium]